MLVLSQFIDYTRVVILQTCLRATVVCPIGTSPPRKKCYFRAWIRPALMSCPRYRAFSVYWSDNPGCLDNLRWRRHVMLKIYHVDNKNHPFSRSKLPLTHKKWQHVRHLNRYINVKEQLKNKMNSEWLIMLENHCHFSCCKTFGNHNTIEKLFRYKILIYLKTICKNFLWNICSLYWWNIIIITRSFFSRAVYISLKRWGRVFCWSYF